MSFAVRLTPDVIQVDSGTTASVGVEVANRSNEEDEYELKIEGLDPDWTAMPVPVFRVDAQTTHIEKVLFKPPRVSESVAGSYPFVLTVRSLRTGEERPAQGMLDIRPFHHISLDISPKRGTAGAFRRSVPFDVTVMNLGNGEHTIRLAAADVEDAVSCEFDPERVDIGPGQQKQVAMDCICVRRSLLANNRLHAITVTARSSSAPNVVANGQVQVEQRAFLSPGSFIAFLGLAALGLAWWSLRPQPPTIDALDVSPSPAHVGSTITVRWRASNARVVKLRIDGQTFEMPDLVGSKEYVPNESGTLAVVATAGSGTRTSFERTKRVEVLPLIEAPPPQIVAFDIQPRKLTTGQTFAVRYQLGPSVTRATLSPPGRDLDLNVSEIELKAERVGDIVYQLVAVNTAGRRVQKDIKVTVTDSSDASIVVFSARPTSVTGPDMVRLTWQLANAARAELRYQGEVETVDPSQGSKDMLITQDTSVRIVAYDAKGRTVEREVKVTYREIPSGPPEPTTTTGDGR